MTRGADELAAIWRPLAADFAVERGRVELVQSGTDLPQATLDFFFELLTEQERERVNRLRIAAKQAEALVARGLLRWVLARELKVEAQSILLAFGSNGKPSLANQCSLHFNVSHTAKRVLIALCWDREVGVDVEECRATISHEELAARFFTARESKAIAGLPAEERLGAFFAVWTRKEAMLKAQGLGIAHGLDGFEVPVDSAELPCIVKGLQISDVPMHEPYVAALAMGMPGVPIRHWSFGGDVGLLKGRG